jgi:D-alanyl-D-alanine carboxypeptidase/D-alanyl-D-alanine-endopeptidase (penicillin-binding protein 4)
LDRVLAGSALRGQQVGVLVERLSDGAAIAAHDPDTPLVPASTAKILSVACVLDRLGPAFVHHTRVLAGEGPAADGTVRGPVFLQGGGDPAFRPEDLWGLIASLAAAGVGRIEGDLVLDDSLFETPGRPAGWPPPQPSLRPYDAPQGALALAWDSVGVVVTPARRRGSPATIEIAPLRDLTPWSGLVRTGGATGVTFSLEERPDAPPIIRVSGAVARSAPPLREWVHLGNPTWAAGGAAARLLSTAGIVLTGKLRRGVAPDRAVLLAEHTSLPLARIVIPIIKQSSNFGAEMLVRTLAAAGGDHPATTTAGVRRVLQCLEQWDVSRAGVQLGDGAGYSRDDRLTARALVDVLRVARRKAAWGEDFRAALPRAGEDGSLRRRLADLAGRLQAKTGALAGVAALAGYLRDSSGEDLLFAILVNQGPGAAPVGSASVDKIIEAIAEKDSITQ